VALDHRARPGGVDHLLIGTSLPLLLGRACTTLEAWNEAVCDGAWGRLAAKARREDPPRGRPRALAGVPHSFEAFCGCSPTSPPGAAARRRDDHDRLGRRAPRLPRRGRLQGRHGARSRVWQAVCSPFRKPI
jgi:hypothetical protein